MPSPQEILMREDRRRRQQEKNAERPGAKRNKRIRDFGSSVISGGKDLLSSPLDLVPYTPPFLATTAATKGVPWYLDLLTKDVKKNFNELQTNTRSKREEKKKQREVDAIADAYVSAYGIDRDQAQQMAELDYNQMTESARAENRYEQQTREQPGALLPGTALPSMEALEWGQHDSDDFSPESRYEQTEREGESQRNVSEEYQEPSPNTPVTESQMKDMDLGELFNLAVTAGVVPYAEINVSDTDHRILQSHMLAELIQTGMYRGYNLDDENVRNDVRNSLIEQIQYSQGQPGTDVSLLDPSSNWTRGGEMPELNFSGAPVSYGNTQMPAAWRHSVSEGRSQSSDSSDGEGSDYGGWLGNLINRTTGAGDQAQEQQEAPPDTEVVAQGLTSEDLQSIGIEPEIVDEVYDEYMTSLQQSGNHEVLNSLKESGATKEDIVLFILQRAHDLGGPDG